MKTVNRQIVCLFLTLCILSSAPLAQTADMPSRPLSVGYKSAPPFVIVEEDGHLSGITADLWRQIAEDMNIQYELVETDLAGLLDGLQTGQIDVAAAALTTTAARERQIDFSQPFFSTGLSIAISTAGGGSWLAVVKNFLSMQFFQAILALIVLLFAVGLLAWLFERKRNPDMFGGKSAEGIGSGFWWSAVTMTTVGYGDKAPVTLPGRILGLVWMFAGLIVISSFTAAITSALTVTQLGSDIQGPDDLYRVEVATVANSASAAYLEEQGIHHSAHPTIRKAMEQLAEGDVDAVVYDAPILKYLAQNKFKGRARVLPGTFVQQNYAIGLPQGSPMLEQLNRSILEITTSPQWSDLLATYLGE